MRLTDHQRLLFAHSVALSAYVLAMTDDRGAPLYAVRYGDAYRDPRAFGAMGKPGPYGADNSNHKQRLAVDLILDRRAKSGRFVWAQKSIDYRPLGLLWEGLDPHNRWGGRYADGNHFERVIRGWDNRQEPLA